MKNIPSMQPFPGVDNLFYEAFVGIQRINIFNNIYPVFLETYGAGYIKNEDDLEDIIKTNKGEELTLRKELFDIVFDDSKDDITINTYLNHMCSNLNKQCIFIQTISDAMTLNEFLEDLYSFIKKNIVHF